MRFTLSTYGRSDLSDFFALSGLYKPSYLGWAHNPALVFLVGEAGVVVRSVDSAWELASYDDSVCVMQQWRGQWRSDWFRFTVGQARPHLPAVKLCMACF